VTAVEGSYSAVVDANVNLRELPVNVVRADVTRWTPGSSELVVADPSRQGLGQQGVEVVVETGARRVILVSCDTASLGRDAALIQHSGYSLTRVACLDLFPHTFHVEVVSIFDRATP
jgi:23S rRNA (uracil1939-C5)-methyltransferase